MIEEQRRAAVYVQTSEQETFPSAVVEALAASTPVIVSDIPGMREAVIDGITGFLVRRGDTAALACAIKKILHDPALRQRMGRAARDYVYEHFSADVVLAKRISLFEELCHGSQKNACSSP